MKPVGNYDLVTVNGKVIPLYKSFLLMIAKQVC